MNEYLNAAGILEQVLNQGRQLDESFDPLTPPLVQQICYGSIRHYYYYDVIIDELLSKKLPAKHLDLRLIILTGLYSFDHLNRPSYTSVNQAVEAVNEAGKGWAKSLVNAILRRYSREKDTLAARVVERSRSASTNHPNWLRKMIEADWPDRPEIFANNNAQAPMTLRVNQQQHTRDAYLAVLANAEIEARPGKISPDAITLARPLPVSELPGFSDGSVSVQDEAPQLAPYFMNLAPGLIVLDACAAPGGKTCHILEHQPEVKLTAIDWDKKRVHRISDNLERLSLTATVINQRLEDFEAPEGFDRILLDVPCSATGIIRRHPDIKLLRTKSDIAKLASIQGAMLTRAFELLREGGELLYSTCSILQQENDAIIAAFAADNPCTIINLSERALEISPQHNLLVTPFGIQLFPTQNDHDGFYYASLRKSEP